MVLIRGSPAKDLLGISNRKRGRFKYSVESQTSKLVHTHLPSCFERRLNPGSHLSCPRLWNSSENSSNFHSIQATKKLNDNFKDRVRFHSKMPLQTMNLH